MCDQNKSEINVLELSKDEIVEAYEKLLREKTELEILYEKNQQTVYELQRNLDTANAAEAFLSQELELISSTQNSDLESLREKHAHEIEAWKNKYKELQSNFSSLECQAETLGNENEEFKNKIKEHEYEVALLNVENVLKTPFECSHDDSALEAENVRLVQIIDEYQEKMNKSLMLMAEREKKIESLTEHLRCAEENLRFKQEELAEKSQLLENCQEKIIELNSEIATLKAAPENIGRKGNSLFAEVDDQRQSMKILLMAQKKNYLQLKKMYNDSQYEMRRLKRENAAMHKELEICSNLFVGAEKLYKEKLIQRIQQLLKENQNFEKRLSWYQEKLSALAVEKGITWLDTMLSYCKNETQELKKELYGCRIQKCDLDESFQNCQKELAKWRFEALKSRCVIIQMETLLEENNIPFAKKIPISTMNITDDVINNAKPRIIYVNNTQNGSKWVDEAESRKETKMPSIIDVKSSRNSAITDAKDNNKENVKQNTPAKDETHSELDFTLPFQLVREPVICEPQKFEIWADTTVIDPKQECKESTNAAPICEKNDLGFEIHEDTMLKAPVVEPSPQNCEKNDLGFEIHEDTMLKVPVVKISPNICEKNDLGFDIHEDTMLQVPVVKLSPKVNTDCRFVLKDISPQPNNVDENICLEQELTKKLSIKVDTPNAFPADDERTMEFPLNNLIKITDTEIISPTFQSVYSKENTKQKATCSFSNSANIKNEDFEDKENVKSVFKPEYRNMEFSRKSLAEIESDLALIDKLKTENIDPGEVHKQKKRESGVVSIKNYNFEKSSISRTDNSDKKHLMPLESKSSNKGRSTVTVRRVVLKKS